MKAGLDDDDLEALEQRQIRDEVRRERETQAERERLKAEAIRLSQVRPRGVIGYDRTRNPVYNDNPRWSTNWVE